MNGEIELLKQKIERVKEDLEKVQGENNEKKRTILIDYIAYLKDELKMLEEDERLK
jgi:prefoldin subunit 5